MDVFGDARLVKAQHRLVAPQAAGSAQLLFDRLDFAAHVGDVVKEIALLAKAVADDAFAQEDVARGLGIDATVMDAPPGDDRQAAADHGFLAVDRALDFVPMRLAVFAFAQVWRDLLDPQRIDAGDPPRPQPRGFDQLHAHHPLEALRQRKQTRAGEHREEAAVGAAIGFRFAIPQAELARNPGEQGFVNRAVSARAGKVAADFAEFEFPLALQQVGEFVADVGPLHDAAGVEEDGSAVLAQGVAFPAAAFVAEAGEILPQPQQRDEVAVGIFPLRVRGVGLACLFGGPFARVARFQSGDNRQDFGEAMFLARFDQHASESRIDRQTRDLTARFREAFFPIQRADFAQGAVAFGHGFGRRWIEERKLVDLGQPQRFHPQNHARQRAAADFGVGEFGALGEFGFLVKPDANAVAHAAATALALAGAGLADGLDLQPLDAFRRIPTADARDAGVHHAGDPRNGQRGFRDVGGEDQAALVAGVENTLLVAEAEPREQWQDFRAAVVAASEHIGAFANFALARQEDQDVAIRLDVAEVVHGARDVLRDVFVLIGRQEKLSDGKHPPRRDDHRRGHTVEREELGEGPRVQSRR